MPANGYDFDNPRCFPTQNVVEFLYDDLRECLTLLIVNRSPATLQQVVTSKTILKLSRNVCSLPLNDLTHYYSWLRPYSHRLGLMWLGISSRYIPKYTFQDAIFRDTGDSGVRYMFHAHSTTAVSATFQLGNLGLIPAEVF
jgi:hypothetical protein